jgi:hypothetical protein
MLFLQIVGALVGLLSCFTFAFIIAVVIIGEINRSRQERKKNSQLQMRKDECYKKFLADQKRKAEERADRPFMFYDQMDRETALNEHK